MTVIMSHPFQQLGVPQSQGPPGQTEHRLGLEGTLRQAGQSLLSVAECGGLVDGLSSWKLLLSAFLGRPLCPFSQPHRPGPVVTRSPRYKLNWFRKRLCSGWSGLCGHFALKGVPALLSLVPRGHLPQASLCPG
jgi:hypothetical protein